MVAISSLYLPHYNTLSLGGQDSEGKPKHVTLGANQGKNSEKRQKTWPIPAPPPSGPHSQFSVPLKQRLHTRTSASIFRVVQCKLYNAFLALYSLTGGKTAFLCSANFRKYFFMSLYEMESSKKKNEKQNKTKKP